MSRKHIGICDSCGKEVELTLSVGGYDTPDNWDFIRDIGDLCPNCLKKYKREFNKLKIKFKKGSLR